MNHYAIISQIFEESILLIKQMKFNTERIKNFLIYFIFGTAYRSPINNVDNPLKKRKQKSCSLAVQHYTMNG